MGDKGIRPCGTRLEGSEPRDLVLSDGSRLALRSASDDEGAHWVRHAQGRAEAISAEQARELAGPEFAEYFEVRMRSEAEWLRTLAQWAGAEAERIDEEAAVLS